MSPSLEPLAITGMSLKSPGEAESTESFWKLITGGQTPMRDYPPDRSNIDAFYHSDRGRLDRISARGGNFLDQDISRFDASFFSINVAEAEAMDPQQRLILETVYHAFENAGITLNQASGSKTCVYTGSFGHDYSFMQVKDPMTVPKFHSTGVSMNMLSDRVSWFFNLTGPSATVDTACSSSLIALDLARIIRYLYSYGVAIGSNVIIGLDTGIPLDNLGLLSNESRSFSFDQRGNGYARGEGVGVLVLCPLKDAINHNDTIRAVIRSSGSNQDGRTPGITRPSMALQQQLILDTYKKADLDLSLTRYVEAHGTGTVVGDPIEAQAVGSVFRNYRTANDPVYIGSVKSTIGHLEGASGIAGVIKTVIALEKGIIPPNTDFQQMNPRIDDAYLRIKVADKQISWPTDGLRRASVNSFGFGGSNGHIVLDDAYHSLQTSHSQANHNKTVYKSNGLLKDEIASPRLLVLSSTDEDGFSRLKDSWSSFFSSLEIPTTEKQRFLNNLAYTLSLRRNHLSWRTFTVAHPSDDWSHLVDDFVTLEQIIPSPNVAFIFSGGHTGMLWAGSFLMLTLYLVSIEGLKYTAITSKAPTENTSPVKNKLCHRFEWKPDINLVSNEEIHTLCQGAHPNLAIPKDFLAELEFLVMLRIMETLQVISERDIKPQKPHLNKYIDWMRHHQEQLLGGEFMFSAEPWKSRFSDINFIEGVESRVMYKSKQGELLARVTRHLVDFLNNEMDPLAFLYQDDLARNFYAEGVEYSHGFRYLEKYVDLLAHANPHMKILEVGAGTGSATASLLPILRSGHERDSMNPRYAHWEYTDISRSFFGEAAKRFASEGSRIAFKALDIEDPADQGFEYAVYDLLLASMVFHATSDLARTLTHARRLLKPGGKLILVEGTNTSAIRAAGAFGLLEGWWLGSESYRSFSPFVGKSQWSTLLLQTGYAGCEIFFPDYDDRTCHENALDIGRTLAHHYTTQTQPVRLIPIQDAAPSSRATLQVFLLEYRKPVFYDIGEDIYNRLQSLLLSVDPILWVTNGGGKESSLPKSHLTDGLFRVLPEEDGNRSRYVLALDPTEKPKVPHYETIAKLTQRILSATEPIDTEYIEYNGILQIPRLTVDPVLNKAISDQEQVVVERKQKFCSGPPLKLDVSSPSMLNGFKFIEDDAVQHPLGPNEIGIQNRSVGINFRDLLVSLGQLESNQTGLECAGVVVHVGDSCRRIKVGDRVAALYPTAFSPYIRLPESGPVAIIPAGMSYADAASIPVSFATSYIAMRKAASLQAGESILIHSGAGGTGQAAIQIAQYIGAEVYTTVSSESKKQLLVEAYSVPDDHIFPSRSTGFAKAVMRRTAGKGVNVVFNSLSGDAMLASWQCIAAYGRFIEIGKRDILSNNNLPLGKFLRDTMFRAFDLEGLIMDCPEVCLSALEDILSLISNGILRPVQPITAYGISEIEAAFRSMQTGKHQGKLIIDMRMEDRVMTVLKTKSNFICNGNATYVIAGGLGGIVQSIAAWFVDRGARTLLLLSRSGAKGTEVMKFIDSLQSKCAKVIAPACDISNESALRKVLEEWQSQLPPIKGCIQAAMVLQDCTFEDMSYTHWEAAVKPKAQGSWNLHCLLPRGMEFFILLSSTTGIIGAHGQTNYAAGNTFQDALARYRVNLGERAASLDLGHIVCTGAVASNPKLLQRWQSNSVFAPITEYELKALIDCFCSRSHGYELDCQPSIGAQPEVRERGSRTASWLEKLLFRCMTLDEEQSQDLTNRGQTFQLATTMHNARSVSDGNQAVTRALTAKLSRALALDEKDIDPDKHLGKYGVDSLVAVELRTWFAAELKANIVILDIIGSTVARLAELAASRSKLEKGYST
ncbi:hypothetical protein BDV36DRAFT_298242 [Aspergillus pseudocaelatus]|uniref:Carrier domain-containing protein n=1 Tax=Aspergillus pseudocaelatus TaxID=1825620 RepID=A0ABQ6WDS9_9EURO|nr:hypothetical protein BDV36DRAFT_298242 [Aspergillus pseudocaelatus]